MSRYIDADTLHYKRVLIETEKGYSHAVVVFAKEIDKKATANVPDRKVGKWIEREVVENKKIIEEWQSAKCSVCGKYHTTPYLYYFDNFNYCPNCGAKMEREWREER